MTAKKRNSEERKILAYNTPSVEQGLTRERIVNAALEVLGENGLKNVTTRRIAERLGVNSASLYWHVKNKDELMQLIADRISADVEMPDVKLPWQDRLKQFAVSYRKALLSYRDGVQIFEDTLPFTMNRLRQIEGLYKLIVDVGFTYEESNLIVSLFNNFIMGFVKDEARFNDLTVGQPEKAQEMMSSVERTLQTLPADQFPTLVHAAAETAMVDRERQFEYGIDLLICGLISKLSNQD